MQDQLYLGDAQFVAKARQLSAGPLLDDAEIARLQRRAKAAPLANYLAMPDRNSAIRQAYATGSYSQKEIATAFAVHYTPVSRVVNLPASDTAHAVGKRH